MLGKSLVLVVRQEFLRAISFYWTSCTVGTDSLFYVYVTFIYQRGSKYKNVSRVTAVMQEGSLVETDSTVNSPKTCVTEERNLRTKYFFT